MINIKNVWNAIDELSIQWKDTPGILEIKNDGFSFDTIVVFFDGEILKEDIPDEYHDIQIIKYDAHNELLNAEKMLDALADKKTDLSIHENKMAYELFSNAIKLCNRLIYGKQQAA
jgi:hypothetical protein